MRPSKLLLLFGFCLLGISLDAQVVQELHFTTNEVNLIQQEGIDQVSLKDASSLIGEDYVGQPEIPVETINLILPKGTKASDVNINGSQKTSISEDITLPMVKAPVKMGRLPQDNEVEPDKSYTITQNPFPDNPLFSFENHQYQEYAYVSISFSPLMYNEQTHSLKLYQKLDITVSTSPSATNVPNFRPKNYLDYRAKQSLQQIITNFQQIEEFYPSHTTLGNGGFLASIPIYKGRYEFSNLPSKWGDAIPYVIITNNKTTDGENVGNLVSKFQKFADWKTRKGTPAKVVTVDTILKAYKGVDPNKPQNFNIYA